MIADDTDDTDDSWEASLRQMIKTSYTCESSTLKFWNMWDEIY